MTNDIVHKDQTRTKSGEHGSHHATAPATDDPAQQVASKHGPSIPLSVENSRSGMLSSIDGSDGRLSSSDGDRLAIDSSLSSSSSSCNEAGETDVQTNVREQALLKPHSFRDYRSGDVEQFFKRMLIDVVEPTLPFGLIKVNHDCSKIKEWQHSIPQNLNDRLRLQATQLHVSMATVCHVAWAQVLARICGQQQVVFGTVLSGCTHASDKGDLARDFSTNMLPFLCEMDKRTTLECVQETHERLTALLEHKYTSLALTLRCSSVSTSTPLFSGFIHYRQALLPSAYDSDAFYVGTVGNDDWFEREGLLASSSHERNNYPFGLFVDDYGSGLRFAARAEDPIDPARISHYMGKALESLARALGDHGKIPIQNLEVLPKMERQMLLKDWNDTLQQYPDYLCLHHVFEQQVELTPAAIAVVHEGVSLTYAELNVRANALAHQLIHLGVRPDDLIAICVERSPAMIIGILAILKAGGAYVPLDPFYASDRLMDVIADAAPSILLADRVGRDVLGEATIASLTVVDPNSHGSQETSNPRITSLTPHHLAYVIYTSGSTGKPKGVMLEHQGAVNLVYDRPALFDIQMESRVLQYTSLGFDHSVSEIFSALRCGAALHLVKDDIRLDRQRLWAFLEQHSITHVSFTPTLLQDCKDMPALKSLRTLVVMGEAMPPSLTGWLRLVAPNSTVINEYGPTECSVATTVWRCPDSFSSDQVPIGRPIPNTTVYLLDMHGNPVPLGAVGELYIGGAGVARGYLHQPDLTAERFIPDPFAAELGARMYKTGDLARYLPDGNLVHMGRNDHQVKLRGFRIELGEIETRLSEHPAVSKAVVVAVGRGSNKRLVAYVVAQHEQVDHRTNTAEVSLEAQLALMLRDHLSVRLPEYMIPAAFVRMDAFPLTPNGKLDRRALPEPSDDDFARQEYEAPQGDTEIAMAAIWAELLHVERVGRHDSFFSLGGHSLLAVRLMNRVATLDANLPLSSLFSSPTLAAFASVMGDSMVHDTTALSTITAVSREDSLPLSFSQQRLWFLAQLEGVSAAYHIRRVFRLRGHLNETAWKGAWDELYDRHEALRSIFVDNNKSPEVLLLPPEGMPMRWIDLRNATDIDVRLQQLAVEETQKPFDLAQGPLIRISMIQVADDEHVLVLTQHHIVTDGWSSGIMLKEISQLYTAFCRGEPSPLLPLAIQYPDYAAWQRQWLSGERLQEQSEYWRTALSDAPILLDLSTDRPRPPRQSFKGDRCNITFDAQLTNALKDLSQKHGVTLFMTVLSAWSVVLSRLSGQDDIVIGTPTANRTRQEIEPLIGFFVNTLALRVDMSGAPSTKELLGRVRRRTLDAYANQDLPFEQVVEIVQPPRRTDCTALFQVLFVWQNNDQGEWDLPGLQTTPRELGTYTVIFDLILALWENNSGIEGGLEYATSIFEKSTVNRHIGYLHAVLQAMVTDEDQPLTAVDLMSADERTLVVQTWNDTQQQCPDQVCIHKLFEIQVKRTPDAIAVVHENASLTYRELNMRANAVANQLVQLSVQPDDLVAICVERSLAMIIGILAVMKAGGAYVPLDPVHASERLLDILSDASPSIVLVDLRGMAALRGADMSLYKVIDLTMPSDGTVANPHVPKLSAQNLAYVIYTSGSTGKPKGVMVEHRQVTRLFSSTAPWFDFSKEDVWSLFHSFAFDVSVWEIWGALLNGGKLVVVPQDVAQSPQDMYRLLCDQSVTIVNMTPTAFKPIVECHIKDGLRDQLRFVILAGEALAPAMLQPWFVTHDEQNCHIVNMYGTTETAVHTTYRPITLKDTHQGDSPIGVRLPDARTYVLDRHCQPVPLGAVGELYVGGAGLARGYLNKSEMTAEKFLPDPFLEQPGERLYKTGDLVRQLQDGSLLYLGRNDYQVKIRGFRIELGEIELRLSEHPSVSEAVVITVGGDDQMQLVAYILARSEKQPGSVTSATDSSSMAQLALALRDYLSVRLPEYMIPAAFVRMDAFPLTPNGKLDRRALPEPSDDDFARQEYEAPQGDTETAMAAIWAELLHVERVGRHDSFFSLGGHSLLAVRLMNRVATLGANLPLSSLFSSPTLAAFASVMGDSMVHDTTALSTITAVSREDSLPLSFSQLRLWFLAQLEGVSAAYHIRRVFRLRGHLNETAWKGAWDELYARHEALRSIFVDNNKSPEVLLLPPEGMPMRWIDLRNATDIDVRLQQLAVEETQKPFDLAQGPLIRISMIQVADDEHVLVLTQHHIVTDGWSSGIMLKEISQLYTAFCRGEPSPLSPLAIQYPDYAAWQRQWLSGERLQEQSEYWRTALSGASILLGLPTDRPRPPRQSFKGDRCNITFDAQLTNALKDLSQKHGVTLFMTVLSAWSVVLSRLSGQDDIVIGTPTANRTRQEIEPLIGFFVNTLALRVDMSGAPSTKELLGRVRRRTLNAYANQDLPFEQVVEIAQPPRRTDCTPLFQAMFVWQNNEEETWQLPGLDPLQYDIGQDTSKFDVTLALWEFAGGIHGSLQYATSLYDRSTIERHIGYLHMMLQVMVLDENHPLSAVDILSSSERRLLTQTWNDTQQRYPDHLCLHHLFEQQTELTPAAIAVAHEGVSLTYAELNVRANALAHQLIHLGVRPDDLIAICVERSPAMIIGILAILKAGGAYVPLDPFYASDRLMDVIADAAPSILLADRVGRDVLGEATIASLTVVDPNSHGSQETSNPRITSLTPHHLAYVIYTSGSTGKPKGVMLEHQGAVNLVYDRPALFDIQMESRVLQYTSLGFDHSVSEIFSALRCGAALHLVKDDIRLDRQQLWAFLERHSITHISFTPTFLQDCKDMPALKSLKTLVVMGEAMPPSLTGWLRLVAPNCTVINEYGPTECSVATTVWRCPDSFSSDQVPIGRPISNTTVYLLDMHGNPVPLGAVGELYIGGAGVARGYLHQPDLTAERFIPDPFAAEAGARMYKTGDLARYLPDGNLVHMGRNDHQVKLRGFRIELGEIETRLSEHPAVSKAVVVAVGEGSSKRLVAYVVAHYEKLLKPSPNVAEVSSITQLALILRDHLATRLPEYMIPAAFVRMDAFPLTPSGKLNRHALPDPAEEDFARQEYEAPQGEFECTLADIWAELLRIERVGRHDSFFALGGHSLLVVQVISRLHRQGYSVSVRTLFESPTLSVLAQAIGQHASIAIPPNLITPGALGITPDMLPLINLDQADIDRIVDGIPGGVANIQDIYALSPLQDGILFHHLMARSGDPYVHYSALSFDTKMHLDQFLVAIQRIVDRHDILRTAFVWKTLSVPAQVVLRNATLSVTELQLDPATGPVTTQLRKMFDRRIFRMDLTQAPLLRFIIAQENDGRWILVQLRHHLISDHSTGATMQIEIKAFLEGQGDALPPAQPYRNLVAQARLGISQEEHERFFTEMLADIGTPALPFGITDVYGDGAHVTQSKQMLSQDLNIRIRSQAKRLGVSVASLSHVAWAQVVAKTSGQDRVVFGTVLFGRMQAATSSDHSMGLFINTLPIRIDLDRDSVEESVRATHARLAALLEHEHASLAVAQRCCNIAASVPLFSALLNYRHNTPASGTESAIHGMENMESVERNNYPLAMAVEDYGSCLGLTAKVVQPLVAARICGYMQEALCSLTDALEQTPSLPVMRLKVIPTEERRMLLQDWNDTLQQYPDYICLHHVFEQQVELTPAAIAVVHEGVSLTYAELNIRANALAHQLIHLGVRPDDLVAICVERSPAMIIGILAILKAGGAYVPLDPFYASDRLMDVIADAAPSILLADHVGRDVLGEATIASLTVIDPNNHGFQDISSPRITGLTPHHLAYVIYTSGSTGKPKGVMLEHQGAVNLVYDRPALFDIQMESRVLQYTSLGFDHSVSEIFSALRCGAALHLVKDDIRLDRQQLWAFLEQHSITHISFTPILLQDCKDMPALKSLRTLVVMGEAMPPSLTGWLRLVAPNSTVINEYGPTECSVATTVWRCPDSFSSDQVPIGRPIPNTTVYLLDMHGNPVPLGAVGELYIGGAGVARGYLHQPDLTAERFIPDPFAAELDARMYKTGDLARYLPDGNLVHMGRNDHQVKLRGFRIELGEIETRLSEHPAVSKAVVVAVGRGSNKRLVAYVVAQHEQVDHRTNTAEVSLEAQLALMLRDHLSVRLPEYMIPAAFVRMDAFPLTPNGKLDRRALPEPSDDDFARQEYEAPQGDTEIAMAAIWAELLHVERVGRHDSFFSLGGHSLLAVRLMNRVATLGANLPLSSLFSSPTLAAFASVMGDSMAHDTTALSTITAVSREDSLPLSFSQQRLWFLAQLEGVSAAYHIRRVFRLRGHLNETAWKRAWDELYARHEALRSIFVDNNESPEVLLLPSESMPMRWIDLRNATDIDVRLQQLVVDETQKPFDLAQGPLIRISMIQVADDEHVLVLTQHHIVTDGWSSGIMLKEISQLYTAFCRGEPSPLLPLAIQYPDYVAWQRQWLSGVRLQEQSEYWRTALSGASILLGLPTDRPRPPRQSFKGDRCNITFDAQLTTALKDLSQKHGVTLFMAILSAWSVVLSRLSGQDDIVIGTPTANRTRQEIEPLIGFFVNTLALRVDMSGAPSTKELLGRVRRRTLNAYANQDLPFEQVVEIAQPPRRTDCTPLFQAMFVWQNNEEETWQLPGLDPLQYDIGQNTSKFDVTLALWESGGGIRGALQYATSLYDRSTVERHVGYLHAVLQAMVTDEDQPLTAVDLMSADERTLVVQTWNDTQQQCPDQVCIHKLFEMQVERTPKAIVVVHGNASLAYRELNMRANAVANQLVQLSVQPDDLVAICVERSLAMIIGILAVMKAGGAYVPLDPAHASERLLDILSDASPSIVLVDLRGMAALRGADMSLYKVIDLTMPSDGTVANPHVPKLSAQNLAYVIYTSGSTGKPKGVMVEHRQVTRLFSSTAPWFDFSKEDVWSLFHSFAFDVSVWEIWGALLNGGKLVVVPQDVAQSPQDMYRLLCDQSVTIVNMTPTAFKPIVECHTKDGLRDQLRFVILAGEALAPAMLQPWFVTHDEQNCHIVNMYGTTETAVHATYRPITLKDTLQSDSPIGVRFPDVRTYVLDRHCQPVPLGAVGELYVGGAGLARGYLNKSEMTAEKFLPGPFLKQPGERLYKTGDLVRQLQDGSLLYLGRNDYQVKIRGFRIELGEIELRLSEHPSVSEAVVITAGEDDQMQLVAYIVARSEKQPGSVTMATDSSSMAQLALALRDYLSVRLPEYMIPAAFVRMDAFPLTPNGKLDRRALPEPSDDDFARQEYEAPQGDTEIAMAAIWAELLHVERVGRHDSFFSLGGHSLLAVRLMNRIASLGAHIPLAVLFNSPTLAAFACAVNDGIALATAAIPAITPISRDSVLPLSYAQQRLWVLAHFEGVSQAYHVPKAVRLLGHLDLSAWRRAWDELYARHEALRCVFVDNNGSPEVLLLPSEGIPMSRIDLRSATDSDVRLQQLVVEETQRPFDLAQGPLIRTTMIQVADDEHVLVLTQHHIVTDGWSSGIILKEISQLYTAFCRGEPSPLPPLAIQYPDYAAWQRQWLSGERLQEQSEYWRTALSGAPVLLDLPTDRPRPPQQALQGDRHPITFDAQLTSTLKDLSQKHGVTLFMTVLSAWSVVLSRLSGQDDIVIGTPTANRTRQEIEPLIGVFINTLAMRVDLSDEPSPRALLERVRRCALGAYANQDLPFEQVVEIAQPPRRTDYTPLFQVMFLWQNNEEAQWNLPGLHASQYDLDYDAPKFDLMLGVWESDDGIDGSLQYATSLFDQSTIERHVGYLHMVLQAMVSDEDQPLRTVDIMSPAERRLLVQTWNDTQQQCPDQVCIHKLFEMQVERTPDAIAVVHGNASLTYRELNMRANAVANQLVQLSVQPDDLVAICVERSLAMIIGILAVMKAGGAYVPLDPAHASERLLDILSDASPSIVLVDLRGMAALRGADMSLYKVIDLTMPSDGTVANPHVPKLSAQNLAYVIYTSGSTGKPKGVMVEHRQVTRLFSSTAPWFDFSKEDVWSLFHSFAFDVSVWEIWGALLNGGKLVVVPQDVAQSPQDMYRLLCDQSVTIVNMTPTAFKPIVECHTKDGLRDQLRFVILAGEALAPAMLQPWFVTHDEQNCHIVNMYGPTETAVYATYRPITLKDTHQSDSPIGVRLPDVRTYVLDSRRQPVPLGAVGELYVGGAGLARGYLNKSEMTAEKFLPDPFLEQPGERLYKTGDLVRQLQDGSLLYLGRNDYQVKIRGFRIELGEIELRLSEHPSVSEAVVITAGEDDQMQLVAYIVARSEKQPESATMATDSSSMARLALTLRDYLSVRLPEYMIPAVFVRMDAFPLTPNGKLDRRALPHPTNGDYALQVYKAPKGETEIVLSTIWQELLKVEEVGRHDNFFTLGGHSLMAVRMIGQIRNMLGFDTTLRTLFEAPTIAELAPRLLAARASQEESYEVLLPIKPQGSRTPLFCVHPGNGLSWCFTGLSTRLEADQPLYGLQARGFTGDGRLAGTLDEMVQDYIDQIRRIQPHGPYYLLGYSFGGLVAVTMASYLEKQGERVALLATLDSRADNHIRAREEGEEDVDAEEVVLKEAITVGDMDRQRTDLLLDRTRRVSRNIRRISRTEAPRVFKGDLLILRATIPSKGDGKLLSPEDWRPYVLGEIEVHDVESEHARMLMPESTVVIGRVLCQKLNELQELQ